MQIEFSIHVQQDDIPVRGNAIASGDDAYDRKVEDKILARLDDGDVWAWAAVEVRAEWNGLTGHAYLGGCCYEDEEDFKRGGYYEDMKFEALTELQRLMTAIRSDLDEFDAQAKELKGAIVAGIKAQCEEQVVA